MAIKPILFNTEMVRAILDGRKTCTRRVVKPQWKECPHCKYVHNEYIYDKLAENVYCARCGFPMIPERRAPYQAHDVLYVRETWGEGYEEGTYIYKADDRLADLPTFKESSKRIYHPSIHMPKQAARIWLKVTDVRVERLQDITEDGSKVEGAIDNRGFIHSPENECDRIHTAREHFIGIWDNTINKSDFDIYGWDANPYVFVIEFVKIDKPEETQNA